MGMQVSVMGPSFVDSIKLWLSWTELQVKWTFSRKMVWWGVLSTVLKKMYVLANNQKCLFYTGEPVSRKAGGTKFRVLWKQETLAAFKVNKRMFTKHPILSTFLYSMKITWYNGRGTVVLLWCSLFKSSLVFFNSCTYETTWVSVL